MAADKSRIQFRGGESQPPETNVDDPKSRSSSPQEPTQREALASQMHRSGLAQRNSVPDTASLSTNQTDLSRTTFVRETLISPSPGSERSAEKSTVANPIAEPSRANNGDNAEKNFGVAVAIFVGLLITGLLLLGEHEMFSTSWWYGAVYTFGGGVGAMSVTPIFRDKFPNMARAVGAPKALWAAAAATWLLLALDIGFSLYDHFSARPFAMGISPIAGTPELPPEPEASRAYIKKTLDDLSAICANRTAMQCDTLMADEKGKWIEISGQMQSVGPAGEVIGAVIFVPPSHGISCIFAKKWHDRLSLLRPFEPVKIAGKISRIQSGAFLGLEACELRG